MKSKEYLRPEISAALRIASFVAAVCVVMIHANSDGKWNFICHALTGWAVPFFFACSGFFFGIGDYVRGGGCISLMRKKFWSLFVPYVLWILIAAAVSIPLVIVVNWAKGDPLLERTLLLEFGSWSFFDKFFAIGCGMSKYNGPMWFVRVLIIMFSLAPLLRILSRRWLAWILIPMVAYLGCVRGAINFSGFCLNNFAVSYFLIGIVIAVYLPRRWYSFEGEGLNYIVLPWWVKSSFWIFCMHGIFNGYVISLGHYVLGEGEIAKIVICPISVVISVFGSMCCARVVRNKWPRLFALLNGGR